MKNYIYLQRGGVQNQLKRIAEKHEAEYLKYGATPKSLFWGKGKQRLRFYQLLRDVDLKEELSILDVGCGFGDLNRYLSELIDQDDIILKRYNYVGIDISKSFYDYAQKEYKGNKNIEFMHGNVLDLNLNRNYDITLISGTLNYRMDNIDNYQYVEQILKKLLKVSGIVVIDFLSDKVEYKLEELFYYNPSRILDIAYKYSRNLILRNDCMPFEFSLHICKNDSFDRSKTTFNSFLEKNSLMFSDKDFSGEI